ncbi:serine endoprotease [Salmonella enterica subsp. enterica serovar Enteritidis str. 22558]|nr:serine endoprotease [Salmonella enterica subsp. enterica serovar Enteritidis str. 22558]
MLEKVLPAVVSVKVEGTAAQSQKVPEEFKNSLARICQTSRPSRLKDSVRG